MHQVRVEAQIGTPLSLCRIEVLQAALQVRLQRSLSTSQLPQLLREPLSPRLPNFLTLFLDCLCLGDNLYLDSPRKLLDLPVEAFKRPPVAQNCLYELVGVLLVKLGCDLQECFLDALRCESWKGATTTGIAAAWAWLEDASSLFA